MARRPSFVWVSRSHVLLVAVVVVAVMPVLASGGVWKGFKGQGVSGSMGRSAQAGEDEDTGQQSVEDDQSGGEGLSLWDEVRRRLRGDFVHPITDKTQVALHYDLRDFNSGLRGLGIRHTFDVPGVDNLELRCGLSVKRLAGIAFDQLRRMGRLDRLLWGSLHVVAPDALVAGATYDGAAQHVKFEASRSMLVMDDLVRLRFTASPYLSKKRLSFGSSVPRRPYFSPSVDVLSTALACEWAEPISDDMAYYSPSLAPQASDRAAAVRVSVTARTLLRPGGQFKVQWLDTRLFGGRGLTTATFTVPIDSSGEWAHQPLSLSFEHTWQLPWPRRNRPDTDASGKGKRRWTRAQK